MYLYRLSKFVLAYSLVVQIHYVMGFVLLLLVYWGVLARIRKMRKLHSKTASTCWYLQVLTSRFTAEPLNKGHFGTSHFVSSLWRSKEHLGLPIVTFVERLCLPLYYIGLLSLPT